MAARRIPPLTAPLTDGVVSLRTAAERDIPEVLIAHDDDPGLHRALGTARSPSGAELGRAMEAAPARRSAGETETLSILVDERFAGQLTIAEIEWADARAELELWVAPGARGLGTGRRALRLAAHWLTEEWRLERLELRPRPDDAAMIACARAAGFAPEGVLRGHARGASGEREDRLVMSLLPVER